MISNFLSPQEEEGIVECIEHVFEEMGTNKYLYGQNARGMPLHINRLDMRHSQGNPIYSPEGYVGMKQVPGNLIVDVLLEMFVRRLYRILHLASLHITAQSKPLHRKRKKPQHSSARKGPPPELFQRGKMSKRRQMGLCSTLSPGNTVWKEGFPIEPIALDVELQAGCDPSRFCAPDGTDVGHISSLTTCTVVTDASASAVQNSTKCMPQEPLLHFQPTLDGQSKNDIPLSLNLHTKNLPNNVDSPNQHSFDAIAEHCTQSQNPKFQPMSPSPLKEQNASKRFVPPACKGLPVTSNQISKDPETGTSTASSVQNFTPAFVVPALIYVFRIASRKLKHLLTTKWRLANGS